MSLLTSLQFAIVEESVREVNGTTLTNPVLLFSDGTNVTYGVDVDIGQSALEAGTLDIKTAPLRNVPIAKNNRDLVYTTIGTPVRLRRTDTGRFEVVGLSKTGIGTYIRVPVCIEENTFGVPKSVGLSSRLLTYDELASFGGYGIVPYGAVALFTGGVFTEIL
ncbi:MAG: hypothetical protein KAJ03_12600 [Gammaproteobacteria bacterium]|nr:hypothetical protein [Gammaproteobacteria bacterium]